MKKTVLSALAFPTLVILSASSRGDAAPRSGEPRTPPTRILSFQHMYGVDGPFVGSAHRIRGIPGDEEPWGIVGFAKGRLYTNGHLRIQVKGLVFTEGDHAGTNDEAQFRGVVSCLTELSETEIARRNVVTAGFPANMAGDSIIDTHIELPNPCVAPIVFVIAGGEFKWFAVTGFESEEEEG